MFLINKRKKIMFFELALKVNRINEKGDAKEVTERYITNEKCMLFAEAEQRGLNLYNNDCEVVAIKISNIKEFVNERTENDQNIYFAQLEDTFVDDNGNEKKSKYSVALFATSVKEATNMTLEYAKQGLADLSLVSVKKTSLLDII